MSETIEKKETKETKLLEVIKEALFLDEDLPPQIPLITIQGKTILTSGNFMVISGLPKSFKTSWAFIILASALTKKTMFGIDVALPPHPNNSAMLFDTEQSIYDFTRQVKTLKFLIKQKKLPKNFNAYLFRKYEPDVILNSIYLLVKEQRPKLIILDNLTELVINPNDMLESKRVIQFLKLITAEFDCGIICLLHLAKSNLMSLGNLGSYADRGSQSVLKVTLDKETHSTTLEASMMRSDSFFNPIAIMFDQEAKTFVETTAITDKPKSSRKFILMELSEEEHWNRLGIIFTDNREVIYGELVEEVKKIYGVGTNIAKQQIIPYLHGNKFMTSERGVYKANYYKNKTKKK